MATIALSLHEGDRPAGEARKGNGRALRAVPAWRQQFVGREELVEAARQALQSAAGAGVLLVGGAGTGKTALAQHLADEYFAQACVVQVRGSATTSGLPFGALGFLLAEVAGDALEHPVVVLQEASRLLVERAAGRKLLIVVENAEELDSMSATVLTQLARARMAKLIVSVNGFSGVASQFARLWSGGELPRLDVENLSRNESARFLASLLGGRVSGAAVDALYGLTAGNPLFLRLLALEQRSTGTLTEREGVWVMAGHMVHSGEIVDVVRSWLGTFTPRQRTVLELLAFAAELPLELLHRRGEADVVEELQDLDVLDLCGTGPVTARLKQKLVADVLRQAVNPGRSLELFESVAGHTEIEGLPPAAAVRFADWTLECRGSLGRTAALSAARAANRLQDAPAALRFIRSNPESSRDPEFVLAEARALTDTGDSLAAIQAIERVPRLPSAGSLVRARLMLARYRALRAMPESASEAEAALQQARDCAAAPAADSTAADAAAMRREVALAEAEHAGFCGRFAPLPAEAGEVFAGRDLEPRERVGFGQLLGTAHALAGRTADAAAAAEQLQAALAGPGWAPAEREQARGAVFRIYLALGMWNRCRQLLDGDMVLLGAARGVSAELAAGLLHVHCGRAEKGLHALEGAVAQLRVSDPAGVLPLALAAAAYACALGGDRAQAQQYLQAYARARQTGPWAVRAEADYFRIAAESRLGRRGEAVAELNERAVQAAAGGRHAQVQLYLGAAARLGDLPSAQRLARCIGGASRAQDPVAGPGAAGQSGGEAGLLLKACELAQAEGNDLFAYELAGTVLDLVSDDDLKQQARTIRRAAFPNLERSRSTRRRIEELSDFERNLALAAGRGRSSAALAKELHLSPRTVDWHLGKIYSRLQVSGRAELREILV